MEEHEYADRPSEPKRQADVSIAFERLDKAAGDLVDLVQRFPERLGPVLREPGPEAELDTVREMPVTDLGRRLTEIAGRLEASGRFARDILARIEL